LSGPGGTDASAAGEGRGGPEPVPARRLGRETLAVHLGRPRPVAGGPVNPDVVLSSTYHQGGDDVYGREDNPTFRAFEEAVAGLEGGGEAVAFASGLGAISAVVETLPTPGRVVVAGDAYNGTRRFLSDVAGRGRLRFRTVDVADTEGTLAVCSEVAEGPGRPSGEVDGFGAGGLLWLESPTNPLLAVADLAALAAGAHRLGMHVAVDNTLATPILQRPLDLGADVVVHSATKAISGHSDVILGVAVTRQEQVAELLRSRRSLHGGAPGPWEVWLALRGVRTLALRVDRSAANAAELARRLAAHPAVRRVRYPGLVDDPGHERAVAQMRGFGFMLSFELADAAAADRVTAGLRLITAATSLGGVESLIERRGRLAGEEHLPPGLLRLSVGIEGVDDLWDDLERSLTAAG
jgi:cystathionine gamma-synthase